MLTERFANLQRFAQHLADLHRERKTFCWVRFSRPPDDGGCYANGGYEAIDVVAEHASNDIALLVNSLVVVVENLVVLRGEIMGCMLRSSSPSRRSLLS